MQYQTAGGDQKQLQGPFWMIHFPPVIGLFTDACDLSSPEVVIILTPPLTVFSGGALLSSDSFTLSTDPQVELKLELK